MGLDPFPKVFHVSGLDVNPPRPGEPENMAFSGFQTLHSGVACLFNLISTVPGNNVPVVDDVLFVGLELWVVLVNDLLGYGTGQDKELWRSQISTVRTRLVKTYISRHDRAERVDPERAVSTDVVQEKISPTEESLAKSLGFVFFHDCGGGG